MSNKGKISIPVVIDGVKKLKDFKMCRCTYFSVRSDTPSKDWPIGLPGRKTPLFMVGISSVICQPSNRSNLFDSPDKYDNLFHFIEDKTEAYVDLNDLWLPNFLFERKYRKRGNLFRVSTGLFSAAHNYRNDLITEEEFNTICRKRGNTAKYSAKETRAFGQWAEKHLKEAIIYHKKKHTKRLKRYSEMQGASNA